MKKFILVISQFFVLLILFSIQISDSLSNKVENQTSEMKLKSELKVNPDFGNIPLYFIPNKGQVGEKALYYAKTSKFTLWITKNGLVFDSTRKIKNGDDNRTTIFDYSEKENSDYQLFERDVSRLVFINANKNAEIVPLDETNHRVNYFKGNDPSKWRTEIKTSKAVLYKDIYENIDMRVFGNENQIEYDWIVKPGGNLEDIRFEYLDVKETQIDKEGNLVVTTLFGDLIHKKPLSYQKIEGNKIVVEAEYKNYSMHSYGFSAEEYYGNSDLIIDPIVLAYSTFLGGNGGDFGTAISIDKDGYIYITGWTNSTDFPTESSYQNAYSGSQSDVFITKMSLDGKSLVFSTYLGGDGDDKGNGIACDSAGKILITGSTSSSDFPRANAIQNIYGGSTDAFMTRLSSAGNSLLNSTYLGGNGRDVGRDINIDSDDNIYATGETKSTDFPTKNPFQNTLGGASDVFVTKLSSSDAALVYSTYLGGSETDAGQGIALDSLGSVYVTGNTKSTDFPTENPFQNTLSGLNEAFVTKLSPLGNSLLYSTYLGGSNNEGGKRIVVNNSGNAYVIGYTMSTNFPVEDPYQVNRAGTVDAFITKLSSEGNSLLNSTYFGGNDWDLGRDISLGKDGHIYVIGETKSTDFPTNSPYQDTMGGISDVFITKFSATGKSILGSTYLGGDLYDTGLGIVVDQMGNAYITGSTKSTNFPTEGPYQTTHGGGWDDAYVTKITFPLTLTISSRTGGSTDPAAGSHIYNSGTTVSIKANPEAGYTFSGWTGDVSIGHENDNPVSITMDSDKSITAGFSVISYTISGSVSVNENSGRVRIQSGLKGVVLSGLPGNPQTDGSGLYSATVNHGWSGTATPTKSGYSFSPENRTYTNIVSNQINQDFTVISTTPPEIYLSLNSLNFGATESGVRSPNQKFSISNSQGGTLEWTASPLPETSDWLSCSPANGSGNAIITVSVDPSNLSVGTYSAAINIVSTNATNSPQSVNVTLKKYDSDDTTKPFGSFDTPLDGTTGVTGAIPVTGWVLDDIGLSTVKIYREKVSIETSAGAEDLVYIGDAMFVEGARRDVEQSYPDHPENYQAGWGYMMLTNFLPDQGNGTYVIHAIATDREGNEVSLGTKNITCDNANAVKPFGAIDTPTQGGTESGPFFNAGWALTPMPNKIPEDGSTIYVWVDGQRLGHPDYNQYRNDIAMLFPGYANSDGAIGAFYLNTTVYENGVHTIAWSVEDNAGNSDGIGSRFFTIANTGGDAQVRVQAVGADNNPSVSFKSILYMPVNFERIKYQRGYGKDGVADFMEPDPYGTVEIEIREVERVEFVLGGGVLGGYTVIEDQLRPLPIGSTLDKEKGIFYWQPGPGFIGEYNLVFIREDEYGMQRAINVRIKIRPKFGVTLK